MLRPNAMYPNTLRTLAVAGALLLAACGDSTTEPPAGTPRRASIEITGIPTSVYESDAFTLRAVVRDSAGIVQANAPITWSVSDPRIAEVDDSSFTALRGGTVRVEASAYGVKSAVTLTVNALTVQSVIVTSAPAQLAVGDVVPLGVKVVGEGGRTVFGRVVTLSSANPSVAIIDAAGRVRGVAAGTATIRATAAGVSGTATVAVNGSSTVLVLSKLGGERLPKLIDADSVSWDGAREYHEVYAESGTFTLSGTAQPRYEITVRYTEYDVRYIDGRKSMVVRRTWREYDRGVVAYDGRGDLQLTSEYISPLAHTAFPDVGGMGVRYRVPGTDERLELFYRREPL